MRDYQYAEFEYLKESKLAYIFGSTLFVDDHVFEKYRTRGLPGLLWEEVDPKTKGLAEYICNETLGSSLQQGKLTFTKSELDGMGESPLSYDSCVETGGKVFRPVQLRCADWVNALNKEWAELVNGQPSEHGRSILVENGSSACSLLTYKCNEHVLVGTEPDTEHTTYVVSCPYFHSRLRVYRRADMRRRIHVHRNDKPTVNPTSLSLIPCRLWALIL